MMSCSSSRLSLLFLCLAALAAGCGDDSGGGLGGGGGGSSVTGSGAGSPEQTGKECEAASECYPLVADGDLAGEALCLDRVRGGYCTHACTADTECCSADGECETDLAQVCSPFESGDIKMCFLSCEGDALDGRDEQEFCQFEAARDFICRSSGGGSENRKVCVPGDCGVGAACGADADCTADLTCITGLTGGYCTVRDCAANADCPADSLCVEQGITGERVCLRTCAAESDCSFCRGEDLRASCSDEVDFLEGDPVRVCVPPEF